MIDSGSRDGSPEIARAAGADRARDRARATSGTAARATSAPSARRGDVIAFLTQDATPAPGWLAALREAFALADDVGAVFGPHLPRAGHEPDDRARADRVLRHVRARRRAAAHASAPTTRRSCPTSTPPTGARAGRRSASRTSPTARTRRSAARSPRTRAGARPTTRAPASCTRTTTRRSSSCGATSTSTAGCARRSATSSRSASASTRARRAGAGRRRPALHARAGASGAPGRALDRRARRVHHGGRKAFSALGLARATRCRRACSARCRSSGARNGAAAARRRRTAAARAARRRATRPRLRGDRPRRCANGPAPLLDAVPGDGRPRAAARRVRDPDLQHRLRRPQHHLPARAAARAHGPHAARCGSTTRSATARTTGRRCCGARSSSTSRRVQAPVFREFERLVRRRRRRRHRLADRLPGARAGGRARPRLPDQRPRAGVLRHVGRVRVGGADLPPGPVRHRRQPVAARSLRRPLRRAAPATFQYGVDHDVYRPRPIDAPPRHGRRLRPRGHAAARRRARDPRARGAAAPPARRADRAVRRPEAAADAVRRTSTPASPATSSSRGCSPRRPSASACR